MDFVHIDGLPNVWMTELGVQTGSASSPIKLILPVRKVYVFLFSRLFLLMN